MSLDYQTMGRYASRNAALLEKPYYFIDTEIYTRKKARVKLVR